MNPKLKKIGLTIGIGIGIICILAIVPIYNFLAGCAPQPLRESSQSTGTIDTAAHLESANIPPNIYIRDEESTYLTFPEWFIVYSADEYATFIKDNPPSKFPYIKSINQYWRTYGCVTEITNQQYAFNSDRHLMLTVIGISYSVEYGLKGLYENSIGRLTELFSSEPTAEDVFAGEVAAEYGTFLHTIPWYEFPFSQRLQQLWQQTPLWGPSPIRKIERKTALSVEYSIKAVYGWLIEKATRAVYVPAELEIYLFTSSIPSDVLQAYPDDIEVIAQVDPNLQLIKLPRYENFTTILKDLAQNQVQIREIAGNDDILLTAISESNIEPQFSAGHIKFATAIPTNANLQRLGIIVPVVNLSDTINELEDQAIQVEHIYDY